MDSSEAERSSAPSQVLVRHSQPVTAEGVETLPRPMRFARLVVSKPRVPVRSTRPGGGNTPALFANAEEINPRDQGGIEGLKAVWLGVFALLIGLANPASAQSAEQLEQL